MDMVQQIGEVAGEIWQYLNSNGDESVSITNLAKKIDRKKDEVLFGAGWLAREGKIILDTHKSTVKISLIK